MLFTPVISSHILPVIKNLNLTEILNETCKELQVGSHYKYILF